MSDIRVAIITGAGQGIGAGVAKSFAAAGFKVSLMSPSHRSVQLASQLGGIASAVGEGSIATTQMTQYLRSQAGNS